MLGTFNCTVGGGRVLLEGVKRWYYLGPFQTFEVELFAKSVNKWK